jgi:hypothetical protein
MIQRGYIMPTNQGRRVKSLVNYFFVPKADNIRAIFNGTSCGLNAALWAPNFWLPKSRSATDFLNYNYCSVDRDLGEMFHNFPLPELLKAWSDLELTPFCKDLKDTPIPLPRPVGPLLDGGEALSLLCRPVLPLGRGNSEKQSPGR